MLYSKKIYPVQRHIFSDNPAFVLILHDNYK